MSNEKKMSPVTIQNARIIFRNFAGRKGPYNEEGERSFTLVMDEKLGKILERSGWNVKEKQPYGGEEGAPPEYHLDVAVEYRKGRPPRCILINSRGRLDLGADEVAAIDYADLANVDLSITPYEWTVKDNSGVKAYLKSIFVTINEDELDLKYAQIPDARPVDDNPSLYDD